MRSIFSLLLFAIIFYLSACNNGTLSKEDAQRSLKVLNSDMVNFGSQLNDSPEIKALDFVMSMPDYPFPAFKNTNQFISTKSFSFTKHKGIYRWQEEEKEFKKISDADNIILQINNPEFQDISVIVHDYRTVIASSGEPFPKVCKMEIKQKDETIWDFQFFSEISNDLPENLKLKVKGNNYQISGNLERTTNGTEGKLFVDFIFKYSLKTLIESEINCKIGYSRQGYFFKQIKLNQLLFGHQLVGNIDYANVDPTANNYASSFNENSKLELFEKGKGKVGDLILATVENDELLDYHIQFADNSKALLGAYLPVFNKFINLKY